MPTYALILLIAIAVSGICHILLTNLLWILGTYVWFIHISHLFITIKSTKQYLPIYFSQCVFLGISRLRDMKLIHERSREFLVHMCETIKHLDRTEMQTASVNEAIFQAVERGISEFVVHVLKTKPELVGSINKKNRSIFHVAVEYLQEKIYSLIYGLRTKDVFATHVDTSNNNMLHMASMMSPFGQLNGITGAALKMQRELQWFKVRIPKTT